MQFGGKAARYLPVKAMAIDELIIHCNMRMSNNVSQAGKLLTSLANSITNTTSGL